MPAKRLKNTFPFTYFIMKPQPHQKSGVELSGDCGIFNPIGQLENTVKKTAIIGVVTKNILRAIQQIVPLFCGFKWKDFRATLDHPSL